MSLKNRKIVYDKLMAAGRESHISPALMEEFGKKEVPKPKPKPLPPKPKTKLEVKKDG